MRILIVLAIASSGCGFFNPAALGPTPVQSPTQVDADYKAALATAKANPANEQAIANYLNIGMTVSRLRCGSYLDSLNANQAKLGFLHNSIDSAAGVAEATMGLAAVAGSVVGGFGAGIAVLNQLFENRETAYVPGPDLSALSQIVRKAQAQIEQVITTAPPSSYAESERALADYDWLCSFSGMKYLVTQAVNMAKTRPAQSAPVVNPAALGASPPHPTTIIEVY